MDLFAIINAVLQLVSWSLTSLFSTNTAISEMSSIAVIKLHFLSIYCPLASAAWCGPHPPHPSRYASAWSGFCSAADCTRLNSFLRHCDKLSYMEKHYADIPTMFQEADDALFRTILSNRSHVLHMYLSEQP